MAKKPTPKVIMIDNYDSFTYNLVQYLQELKFNVITHRNDQISVEQVLKAKPDFVVLSPGPSSPANAGICLDLIKACAKDSLPLLGVCLGHQAIGEAFGGKVVKAKIPMHGKVSDIKHKGKGLFKGLANPISATRYHSLIVEKKSLPTCLTITAETKDGTIMGLRHKKKPIEGVQFHPESVLTQFGREMLANFANSVLLLALSFFAFGSVSAFSANRIGVQGHRGARGNFPENTLSAFHFALEAGVDTLEMDVLVTKDNQIVVGHDPVLNPEICLDPKGNPLTSQVAIRTLTLKELQSYDCGSLQNPRFLQQKTVVKEKMPTLIEVFDLVKNSKFPAAKTVNFNIETKLTPFMPELAPLPKDFAKMLIDLAKSQGMLERVSIQSFDHRSLVWSKKFSPRTKIAALVYATYLDYPAMAKNLHADIVSPDQQFIDKEAVDALHKMKVQVIPWTANTPAEWDYLIKIGVDSIISDYPADLIAYLKTKDLR